MVEPIWIAVLNISPETAAKISARHGLTEQEIRDEVVCVDGLRFTWHVHPERGRRAIVEVFIRKRVLVVLYPVSHPLGDVWNLGSAYPANN